MPTRDIIVVGASAGGFEALQTLVAGLPATLPAAVFITLHLSPQGRGVLPDILERAGPLPVFNAQDGMPIETGRIYTAPPDYHLVVQHGFVQLSHRPKEILHRPCINVMFRSAATAYGERVAGVVLTGLLDDGAAGLWEIQQHNGATIVQDPEEATFRSMPDSAIRGLNVQHIVRLREIAPLLARLAVSDQVQARSIPAEPQIQSGEQVCPECGGVMTKAQLGRIAEFRCHTGHRFGMKSLIAQKSDLVEQNLNAALAQSEELTALLRAAMSGAGQEDRLEIEQQLGQRLEEQENLRQMLVDVNQTGGAA